MCGIAGVVWEQPSSAVDAHARERIVAALRHRGPDGQGVYADEHAALALTRLSIIDVEGGRQPLSNEDGTVWTVFNGGIYSFTELRERLQSRGHRFQTNCDTEVIVRLYEDEGNECVKQLRGIFALGIWISRVPRLLDHGVSPRRGIMLSHAELPSRFPAAVAARFGTSSGGRSLLLQLYAQMSDNDQSRVIAALVGCATPSTTT
jgi:glutamine phosphoribosylpyrophosphate amidotransferase